MKPIWYKAYGYRKRCQMGSIECRLDFFSPWLLTAAILNTVFIATTGATLAVSAEQSASAAPEILMIPPKSSSKRLSQVPSADQLSDVQPSNWAFSTLQSLVERRSSDGAARSPSVFDHNPPGRGSNFLYCRCVWGGGCWHEQYDV